MAPSRPTSNVELESALAEWPSDELHALIKLLESRFSPASRRLVKAYPSADAVPPPHTPSRRDVARQVVDLVGWYGANSLGFLYRKAQGRDGAKAYLGILRDVANLRNRRLKRKNRAEIPAGLGVRDLEERVVGLIFSINFEGKSIAEIIQILEEIGLERDVAEDVAKRHGPTLTAGAGVATLVKILGKRTLMHIVQQMMIAIVSRHIGREAAIAMAKRLAVVVTQKTLARLVAGVGWMLVAVDVVSFTTGPARRVTVKAIPFICLIQMQRRLAADDGDAGEANNSARGINV